MKNEKAVSAYMIHISHVLDNLEWIKTHVENHLGYSPDEINWGHVGVMERIEALTNEIAQIVDPDSEED